MSKWAQLPLLLWKNSKLHFRSPLVLAAEILIPILYTYMLVLMRQEATPILKSRRTLYKPWSPSYPFESKLGGYYVGLAVVPGNPVTRKLLQLMLDEHKRQGLVTGFDEDFKPGFIGYDSEQDALQNRGNRTHQYVVVFEGNGWSNETKIPPKNLKYKLMYGSIYNRRIMSNTYPKYYTGVPFCSDTDQLSYGRVDNNVLNLQFQIALAFTRFWVLQQSGDIFKRSFGLTAKCMPHPPYKFDRLIAELESDLPSYFQQMFLVFVAMYAKKIVAEKENRLKETMKMMNLDLGMYWLSWLLTFNMYYLPVIALSTFLLCMVKNDEGFAVLYEIEPSLFFVFMFSYGLSITGYCLLISSLVQSATVGAIVATGTLLFLPEYIFYAEEEDLLSELFACLNFKTALLHGVAIIFFSQRAEKRLTWSSFYLPVVPEKELTLLACMLMFAVDGLLFGVLAWYIDQVYPGEFGLPKPLCFCLEWVFPRPKENVMATDNDSAENPHLFEAIDARLKPGISMHNLRKTFGKKVAVKNTTLEVYKNQITVLLGHNGAGKTATFEMLTGFRPPTSGTAYINGYDIRTHIDKIRDNMSFCPQTNDLFDWLTVREHLTFFSELRGFRDTKTVHDTIMCAKELGLQPHFDTYASWLSGGEKRKLSLTIALIGDFKVVILDEPTTGMDPASRRDAWSVLKKARRGRTILLTTHFMEEAEVLGDRIAFMVDGSVHCCGSAMFLKRLYGTGFRLVIEPQPKCHLPSVLKAILEQVTDAKLDKATPREITVVLPRKDTLKFPQLFDFLENRKESLNIMAFGISSMTMEDVYMSITTETDRFEKVTKVPNEHDMPTLPSIVNPSTLSSTQNYMSTTQRLSTDKEGNSLATFLDEAESGATHRKSSKGTPSLAIKESSSIDPHLLLTKDGNSDLLSETSHPIQYQSSVSENVHGTEPVMITGRQHFWSIMWALFVKKAILMKRAPVLLFIQLLIPVIVLFILLIRQQFEAGSSQMKEVTHNLNMFEKAWVLYSPGVRVPGGYRIASLYAKQFQGMKHVEPILIDLESQKDTVMDQHFLQFIEEHGLENTRLYMPIGMEVMVPSRFFPLLGVIYYNSYPQHAKEIATRYMLNALVQHTLNESFSIETSTVAFNLLRPKTKTEKSFSPTSESVKNAVAIGSFLALGMSFMNILVFHYLIHERQVGAKNLQLVSGTSTAMFWLSNFIFDFSMYLVNAFLIFIALITIYPVPYAIHWSLLLLSLVSYGWASLAFVYTLHFVFMSPALGTGLYIVYNIATGIFPVMLVLRWRLFESLKIYSARLDFWSRVFSPTYNICNCVMQIYINYYNLLICGSIGFCEHSSRICCKETCSEKFCLDWEKNYLSWKSPGIGSYLFALMLQAVLLSALVILIDFQLFERLWYFCTNTMHFQPSIGFRFENDDSDVADERVRILQRQPERYDKNDKNCDQIALVNLHKAYRGKVVVDHLCLGIPRGECVGLLGRNGAGKSKTFDMLTGKILVTSGNAFVVGHNIVESFGKYNTLVGYCPQFKGLIPEMTGRETLTMYARIKGLPESIIQERVNKLMKLLLFDDQADTVTKVYSGGTKRKLSTSIALVGVSPVIFLDEPSSGMDPKAKRQLTETLAFKRRQGYTILLASNSMEESEMLCTRIAILMNGRMVCLGSPQHLKSKFGRGYTFIIQLNFFAGEKPVLHEPVIKYVMQEIEGCELFEEQPNYLHFRAPERPGRLAAIFDVLERGKTHLPIQDYAVHQTLLEEVFLDLTRNQTPPTYRGVWGQLFWSSLSEKWKSRLLRLDRWRSRLLAL